MTQTVTMSEVEAQIAQLDNERQRIARDITNTEDQLVLADNADLLDHLVRLQTKQRVLGRRREHLGTELDSAADRQMRDETKRRGDALRKQYGQFQAIEAEVTQAKAAYESALARARALREQIHAESAQLTDPLIERRDSVPQEQRDAWASREIVRETQRLIDDVRRGIDL